MSDPLTTASEVGITTLIDKALELAKTGDPSGVLSAEFMDGVKKLRGIDENHYVLTIKPIIKSLRTQPPITLGDIDRLTKPAKPTKQRYQQGGDDGEADQPRQGKAELVIDMVTAWATKIFCDESGKAYASFMVQPIEPTTGEVLPAHAETWPLDSKQFRGKVSREFRKQFGIVPGESALKEAVEILAVDAEDRPRQQVFLRYAPKLGDEPGLYVDLVNDHWEVVEITGGGWRIIAASECPVNFRRVLHSRPLPMPERGGDVNMIWKHINIQGDDNQLLVLAWLLEAMRTETPYPVLELVAGQGSAKSTTQERLRQLIDPNAVNLRMEPRSNQDLSVSAIGNHVISLNNLSGLNKSTQDFMCSVSTGGGDATRRLHTTEDEAAWETKRPIVMNGINQLVTRPDLADRTLGVELQRISAYIDEATLINAWAQDYPKILGALYQLMSGVLRDLPAVRLDKLPRMGDFAKLGAAMCLALKCQHSFVEVFNSNRDAVVARGVESSPVALALVSMIHAEKLFTGTPGELMRVISREPYIPVHYDRNAWPKSPRGLGEIIRRLAPSLRVYGIDVQQRKGRANKTVYHITKIDRATDTPEAYAAAKDPD